MQRIYKLEPKRKEYKRILQVCWRWTLRYWSRYDYKYCGYNKAGMLSLTGKKYVLISQFFKIIHSIILFWWLFLFVRYVQNGFECKNQRGNVGNWKGICYVKFLRPFFGTIQVIWVLFDKIVAIRWNLFHSGNRGNVLLFVIIKKIFISFKYILLFHEIKLIQNTLTSSALLR